MCLCAKEKDGKDVTNLSSLSLDVSVSLDKDEQISKVLTKKVEDDSLSSVAVRYNEKYGRHLIATREIRPGEIIFKKKPYVACLNIKKPYVYCCHCLSIGWASVPCNACGWFLFCSEKCKEDAWKQYHDIECLCIPYISHFSNYVNEETGQNVLFDGLSIRTVIKAVRDMDGLEKLKTELQSIDRCTGKYFFGRLFVS